MIETDEHARSLTQQRSIRSRHCPAGEKARQNIVDGNILIRAESKIVCVRNAP